MDEALLNSPLGTCRITANDSGILSISFPEDKDLAASVSTSFENIHLERAVKELESYFAGNLTQFTSVLAPEGTEFQIRVWERLSQIPFGVTKSYGQIADEIGQPKASRAVGGANNKNPIPIMIPCHRVIGSSNALVGFGCGLWRKQWMLEHEGIALPLG